MWWIQSGSGYHQIWQNIKKTVVVPLKDLISIPKPDPPQILIGESSNEFVHRTWIFMLLASRGNPIKIINEIYEWKYGYG